MKSDKFNEAMRELEIRRQQRPQVVRDGVDALVRLLKVAHGDTGQSRVVAAFLLSLYNCHRFKFDLVEFRRLDFKLFDDCISVLKMDHQPEVEVHQRIENGSAIWESLAKQWKNGEGDDDE